MIDPIDRQAAIDALGEEPEVWTGEDEYAQGLNNQWHYDVTALKALPSAQQELPFEIQDILDYLDTVLHPIISPEHWNVYSELHDMISTLPSAQPEIKPIDYQDCANAMLRMWMDNVVTDGEYNRIMDKLNAHWGMKNG